MSPYSCRFCRLSSKSHYTCFFRQLVTLDTTMGIKGLAKLLADKAPNSLKPHKFESYAGREIAVDASLCIYQFLIVVGRNGTEMLTNEAGEVTSHLFGMFGRTIRLMEAGIKPVYVFDGPPPDQKGNEIAKRYLKREDAAEDLADAIVTGNKEDIEKYSKQTVKVSKKHNDDCKKLLQLMGVPVVQAPSEAEAQCAALCKLDKVYAMASEDMDSLAFGAPRFLRHLMDPISRKTAVVEFEIAKVLEELNLTMDQFIDMCILSGCDYCDSIRGIGGQTALKLIRQHETLENVIEKINKQRYQIPDEWEYQGARQLFKEPSVVIDADQMRFQWSDPDEEGLLNFLVRENGFKSDRVIKGVEKLRASNIKLSARLLEPSFAHVACSSSPIVKDSKVILGSFKKAMESKSCVQLGCARPATGHISICSPTTYSGAVAAKTPLSRGFSFIP